MKRFRKFAKGRVESLIDNLGKYRDLPKPETLHQIRVDIKKIKAVLAVIGDSQKGFKKHKNFIPFRKIFRRAGEIRESDVLSQQLLRYKLKELSDRLPNYDHASLESAFQSDIPRLAGGVKRVVKKIEPLFTETSKKEFRHYLRKKRKAVKLQLYPKPNIGVIHKARKSIKEVVYLSPVDTSLKKKEVKFYDKAQDAIGRLHDKQVLLEFLKKNNGDVGKEKSDLIKSECRSEEKLITQLATEFYK